jgi:hypothetical protein
MPLAPGPRFGESERLLDLYSTPYFLKLLCDQLAYDPRVASERAALFTGFVRRALEREIAGQNPLFVRDGVLHARDRERIVRRDWDQCLRPAQARAADPAPAGARLRHAGALWRQRRQAGDGDCSTKRWRS